VRILKYRHTWRSDLGFRAWMYQIARNARVDYVHRNAPQEVNIEDHEAICICPLPTPHAAVERQDDMRIALEALKMLSEERREVLLLRGFQGMKFEEIAQALQCPVNTIKGRAFAAIRELREIVRQYRQEKVV